MYGKEVYVMAIDIEMSGSLLSDSDVEKRKPNHGDIIGIGACVMRWNAETKQSELVVGKDDEEARFFRPMFRPESFSKKRIICESGLFNRIYYNTADEHGVITKDRYMQGKDRFDTGRVTISEDTLVQSTMFEYRCWEDFWSKHPEQLELLEFKGLVGKEVMEQEALRALYEFRQRWESLSDDRGAKFVIVGDNVSFDIGMLDQLNRRHFPFICPMIYLTSRKEGTSLTEYSYGGAIRCTNSTLRGVVAVADPLFFSTADKDEQWKTWLEGRYPGDVSDAESNMWSINDRVCFLYDIPKFEVEHDHHPTNDAMTIANNFLLVEAITRGDYTLQTHRVLSSEVESEGMDS